MVNTKLLRRILEQIESHPETWNQETWHSYGNWNPVTEKSCGTAHCVAGWAEIICGEYDEKTGERSNRLEIMGHEIVGSLLLGLSRTEGKYLFDSSRTLLQVKDFLEMHEFGQSPDPDKEPTLETKQETWRDRPSMI